MLCLSDILCFIYFIPLLGYIAALLVLLVLVVLLFTALLNCKDIKIFVAINIVR